MSRICIVADSSTGITGSLAKELGIEIAPLSIIIEEIEYQDQVEMTTDQLIKLLNEEAVPTTAQPNLGLLDEMMERIKKENYDHIIVFSLSSHLSGTYQAFVLAANNHEITNIDVVDAKTLAGAVKDVVIKAVDMVNKNASVAEILAMANTVFSMSKSYLFPNTLDQLKRGGRVSSTVATLSSLLKIKPLLVLENGGKTFEKAGTARTEAKIFDMIIDGLKDEVKVGVQKIHVQHCDGIEIAQRFVDTLKSKLGDVDVEVEKLPAVLAAHAGIKSIAVQISLVL